MKRIETGSLPAVQARRTTDGVAAAAAVAECRALTVVTPVDPQPRSPGSQRSAAFLAQLLAAKEDLPQARERRRAEPTEAIAAYRSAAARPVVAGHVLRSL